MAKFTVEFAVDNAAFDVECGGDLNVEVARILCSIAGRFGDGETDGVVRDVNGNEVGRFSIDD